MTKFASNNLDKINKMSQFNYTFWDERYSSDEFVYGKEPNEFFKKNLEKLSPGKILLPGEGEGRNAVFAARLGWNVDALDQSIVGKLKAEKLANEFGVKINYNICDLNDYQYEEDFYDAVAIIFVHFHLEHRARIHGKLVKSLKKNGILILEMYNKEQLGKKSGGPQDYDMLYSNIDIERDFNSLKTILLKNEITFLNEGSKHSGEASVIRFIGIKED